MCVKFGDLMCCSFGDSRGQRAVRKREVVIKKYSTEIKKTIKDSEVINSQNISLLRMYGRTSAHNASTTALHARTKPC